MAAPHGNFVKIVDLSSILATNSQNRKFHILFGGPKMLTVQSASEKVKRMFNIQQNIVFKSGDGVLPNQESVQILEYLDNLKVEIDADLAINEEIVVPVKRRRPLVNNSLSVGSFLSMIRGTATTLTDDPAIHNSPLEAITDNQDENGCLPNEEVPSNDADDSTVPSDLNSSSVSQTKPKRKRVRRHKRKTTVTSPYYEENDVDAFANGTTEKTTSDENPQPTLNGDHEQEVHSDFEALVALKQKYPHPPIFKKSE